MKKIKALFYGLMYSHHYKKYGYFNKFGTWAYRRDYNEIQLERFDKKADYHMDKAVEYFDKHKDIT